MPELAEVEYYRKQWNPGLGKKILDVQLHAKKRVFRGVETELLVKTLTGAVLSSSSTHGKQMLFRTKDAWLGIHLGMTGSLRKEDSSFVPDKHDHLALRQAKHTLIFRDPRQFGRIQFAIGKDEPSWWANRAIDILSPQFTSDYVATILQRHKKAPIKAVLLMQQRFPGIGNWMADEVLWQAKIHPGTAAGKLARSSGNILHQTVQHVTAEALRIIGANWGDLPKDWLFDYRWRKGGECPRCKSKLKHSTIGGRTCWCPKCQPVKRADAA